MPEGGVPEGHPLPAKLVAGIVNTPVASPYQAEVKFGYADTGTVDSLIDPHAITLVQCSDSWKLTRDSYQDEFTDTYPLGTDFAALEFAVRDKIANEALGAGELPSQVTQPDTPGTARARAPIWWWGGGGIAFVALAGAALARILLKRR